MAHSLKPDEEHEALELGKVVHENYYTRMAREIEAEGMKVDIMADRGKVIYEVKTSSKFLEATRLQLAYYLLRFEMMGASVDGIIAVPREKRKIRVKLDPELRDKVTSALREIAEICKRPIPPPPVRIPFCRRCAYRDFCWGV